MASNKSKPYKSLDYGFRVILNFYFLGKGLRIISLSHFVYDFSRKMFLMYVLLTDKIPSSDCLYLMRYLTICVLQSFISHVLTS